MYTKIYVNALDSRLRGNDEKQTMQDFCKILFSKHIPINI